MQGSSSPAIAPQAPTTSIQGINDLAVTPSARMQLGQAQRSSGRGGLKDSRDTTSSSNARGQVRGMRKHISVDGGIPEQMSLAASHDQAARCGAVTRSKIGEHSVQPCLALLRREVCRVRIRCFHATMMLTWARSETEAPTTRAARLPIAG